MTLNELERGIPLCKGKNTLILITTSPEEIRILTEAYRLQEILPKVLTLKTKFPILT